MAASLTPEDEIRDRVRLRFQHALQALAQPADVQLGLFPDFVVVADELALDFDNGWISMEAWFDETLNNRQRTLLNEIDRQLDEMSGAKNSKLWTVAALRDNPLWEQLRSLAKEALSAFDWPDEVPPSYAHEYIRGRPKPANELH